MVLYPVMAQFKLVSHATTTVTTEVTDILNPFVVKRTESLSSNISDTGWIVSIVQNDPVNRGN